MKDVIDSFDTTELNMYWIGMAQTCKCTFLREMAEEKLNRLSLSPAQWLCHFRFPVGYIPKSGEDVYTYNHDLQAKVATLSGPTLAFYYRDLQSSQRKACFSDMNALTRARLEAWMYRKLH